MIDQMVCLISGRRRLITSLIANALQQNAFTFPILKTFPLTCCLAILIYDARPSEQLTRRRAKLPLRNAIHCRALISIYITRIQRET